MVVRKLFSKLQNLNADTIKFGTEQLEGKEMLPDDRLRRVGGGRRSITTIYPDLEKELMKLVEAETQGDPESPLLWTSKSLDHLANELGNMGYPVSTVTISKLLEKTNIVCKLTKKGLREPLRLIVIDSLYISARQSKNF